MRTGAVLVILLGTVGVAQADHKSSMFQGAKANKGYVMHSVVNGKNVLTLSADFVPPQTPDPHWQLVDSKGNVYLVDRLMIKKNDKGEKPDTVKMSITVPAYVPDIAKVQMYCAWAETVLGEASFEQPVMSMK
jgi:hypothetical protein